MLGESGRDSIFLSTLGALDASYNKGARSGHGHDRCGDAHRPSAHCEVSIVNNCNKNPVRHWPVARKAGLCAGSELAGRRRDRDERCSRRSCTGTTREHTFRTCSRACPRQLLKPALGRTGLSMALMLQLVQFVKDVRVIAGQRIARDANVFAQSRSGRQASTVSHCSQRMVHASAMKI
jgi:hypothetical protein